MSGIPLGNGMGKLNFASPPADIQILQAILQIVDAQLQLQCRILMGWDPAEAIKSMGLHVVDPPVKEVTSEGD